MDITSAIVSLIKNSSSVATLITAKNGGIKLRPINNATTDVLPILTYSISGTETFDTFTGNASVQRLHFQFDVFAADYATARAILKAVKGVLHNYQGMIEDCRISLAKHKEDYDNSEPPDVGQEKAIIRLASSYLILYRETN